MNVINTIYLNGCNYQIGYDLLSQDITNNFSRVRFYGVLNVTNNYISWSSGYAQVWSAVVGIGTYYSRGSYTLVQGDYDLYHNADGTYSTTCTGSLNTTFVSGSTSGEITLPKINKYPILNSGRDITDEQNPIFNYTAYNTFNIRLKLEAGGKLIATRNMTSKGSNSSYTMELTDEEREELIKVAKAKETTIRYVVCALNGNTEINWSYKDYKMTLVDAEPTFTHIEEELNQNVIDLMGSSVDKVVLNATKLMLVVNPQAKKYGNISFVRVIHNNQILEKTEAPYVFEFDVVNPNYTIQVIDNRNIDKSQDITKDYIEYNRVEIKEFNFKRENPTSSNIVLELDGLYYQKKFGNVDNAPKVEYKLNDGEYINISDFTIDEENNKIYVNTTLNNILPHTLKGTLYIKLSDLLTTAEDNMEVIRGIPTFEWGETDVQVNGTLYIADENRENPINVLEKMGEIVESGNNSNGNWIKYADGTLIQVKKFTFTPSMAQWGGLYYADVNLGKWAISFISVPFVNVSIHNLQYWVTGPDSITATNIGAIRLYRQINLANYQTYVSVIGIGRWK